MSQSDQEPDSLYTNVAVPDDDLPEDLQPGEDNPLAGPADADDQGPDEEERQDLGDPHIDGLGRDDDDAPVAPDTDASEDAHHGAPDSDD
jgi:hypothetical protein